MLVDPQQESEQHLSPESARNAIQSAFKEYNNISKADQAAIDLELGRKASTMSAGSVPSGGSPSCQLSENAIAEDFKNLEHATTLATLTGDTRTPFSMFLDLNFDADGKLMSTSKENSTAEEAESAEKQLWSDIRKASLSTTTSPFFSGDASTFSAPMKSIYNPNYSEHGGDESDALRSTVRLDTINAGDHMLAPAESTHVFGAAQEEHLSIFKSPFADIPATTAFPSALERRQRVGKRLLDITHTMSAPIKADSTSILVVPVVPASVFDHSIAARPCFDEAPPPPKNYTYMVISGGLIMLMVASAIAERYLRPDYAAGQTGEGL